MKAKQAPTQSKVATPPRPPADLWRAAPDGCSTAARQWFDAVRAQYNIVDLDGLMTLHTIVSSWDRAERAAALIVEQGELIMGPKGGYPRAHPAAAIERDARRAVMAALRHLDIGVGPPKNRPGRPPRGA